MPHPRPLIRLLLAVLLGALATSAVSAQERQYKRLGLDAMNLIVDGDFQGAREAVEEYLALHPGDPEALYVRTVLHAQEGDTTAALETARQAVEAGLPFERLLAGPRALLEPLTGTAGFAAWASDYDAKVLHGPMLGAVTYHSARFWVRTRGAARIHVRLYEILKAEDDSTDTEEESLLGDRLDRLIYPEELVSSEMRTRATQDYTAVIPVFLLKPDTRYRYNLVVNDVVQPGTWTFRTMPRPEAGTTIQIAFGGGAGYTPDRERMWRTIAGHDPRAFLFLGDNVYIDTPERPEIQRYVYYRRQSRPEYRDFVASTSIFAIWDDHDFTDNDGWGGPEIETPAWKRDVWNVFRENWANPAYGGEFRNPGCWFSFKAGDIEFFMLDSRYYREDPNRDSAGTEPPSMLGPVQMDWLKRNLDRSTATFKVIASPVPWAEGTKPGSLDTWDGYAEEREEIFSYIERQRIDGVFLISADRHRSDVWKIDRPQGYDLYEFESSRLTNMHAHQPMEGAEFSYNEKNSFGILTFDTTRPDPAVTYRIMSIDDEEIHAVTLLHSQLTHAPVQNEQGRRR